MYCGVPLGASLAALIGLGGFETGWKTVFFVGGIAPLLVAPLLAFWLPESAAFRERQQQRAQGENAIAPPSLWQGLFKEGSAVPTLLLWVAYFFTLMVVYMLINWLPSLIIGQGFAANQANLVMFSLQIGATLGTLALGALMDRLHPMLMTVLTYLGILAALMALGAAANFNSMLGAGFIAGFFAVGGQLVLYALAPLFYQTEVRASGVGSAVAVGRLGAMTGPLVAGHMLATGAGAAGVMLASAPGILLAACAMSYLLLQRRRQDLALN